MTAFLERPDMAKRCAQVARRAYGKVAPGDPDDQLHNILQLPEQVSNVDECCGSGDSAQLRPKFGRCWPLRPKVGRIRFGPNRQMLAQSGQDWLNRPMLANMTRIDRVWPKLKVRPNSANIGRIWADIG